MRVSVMVKGAKLKSIFQVIGIALVLAPYQSCGFGAGFKSSSVLSGEELSLASQSPMFQAARNVISAKCVQCHDGHHDDAPDFRLGSDLAFVRAGLVQPGSLATSKLIYRL